MFMCTQGISQHYAGEVQEQTSEGKVGELNPSREILATLRRYGHNRTDDRGGRFAGCLLEDPGRGKAVTSWGSPSDFTAFSLC